MKFKNVPFILFFFIFECRSQDDRFTNCPITENIGEGRFIDFSAKKITVIEKDVIKDIETLDVSFPFEGPLTVSTPNSDDTAAPYLEVTINGGDLHFKTTEQFSKFDEDHVNTNATAGAIPIQLTVQLNCDPDESAQFTLSLYVQDTNNHPPTFNSLKYEYEIPMPLVPKVDLTSLGEEIIVTDFDFTNENIHFKVNNENFDVETKVLGARKYRAVLKAKKFISYDTDLSLTMTATDTQEPTKNNTTTITIKKDADTSLPNPPTFSQSIYTFQYNNTDNSITPTDGEIKITTSDASKTTSKLSDETYFTTKLDGDIVTISRTDTPIETVTQFIMALTLTITLDSDTSEAAIIISFPSDIVVTVPKFSNAYYTATYFTDTEQHNVTLDKGQHISVTPKNAEVALDGEYAENFTIKLEKEEWVLALKGNLDDTVLKNGDDLVLKLKASITGEDKQSYEGFSAIVVKLPKSLDGPSFEKTYYTATYKVKESDDTIEVTNGPISLKNVDGNVEVSFDKTEQYSDAFEIIQNENNTYRVNVINGHIDDEVLIDQVDIVLTLKATVDELVGEATLVIQLPKEVAPASFKKSVYVGTYDRNADSKLSLEDIELTGNYLAKTKVDLQTPNELKDYFTLDGKNPYNITLNGTLPDFYLNEHHEIVLTLIANLDESSLTTSATIVIEITDLPKAPKFSKPVYRGKYEVVENKGKVSLSDNIETDATDPSLVHFTIESNYRNNFNIIYDETSKQYKVEVSKLLEDTTEPEISVIVDATIDGAPDVNSASLLLTMPEKISDIVPEFSDIVYEATYSITGNNQLDTITLLKPIEIISDQAKATKVEIIDQYKSNFNINESLQINVIKNLDLTILQQKDIVISLQATLKDSKYVGIATVLLAWEEQSFKRAPKFSKPFYTADYTVSNVLENVEPIVIENVDGGFEEVVNVTVEEQYKSLISIFYNESENKWIASIQQPLDLANLDSELLIKLTAHLDGSVDDDTATLAISLPTVTFGKAYYSFTYKQNSGKDDDELIDGSDINVTEGANVSIPADSSEYSNHFNISCEDAQCSLKLNGDLTDDILKKESEIILTLEAKLGATTGQTTVIISLPLQEKAKAPIFTKTVYIGTYQDNSGEPTVDVDPKIQIDGVASVNGITLTLEEGNYTKYFGLKPKNNYWEVTTTLKQDDIKNIVLIPLTLLATKDGVTEPGRSSLVIQLPTDTSNATFHFAASVYTADYKDDQLNITDIITIEGDEDSSAEVTLDGDPAYKSCFSASYDEKTVHITLTDDKLPPKVLNKYSVLYLTINAVKDGNTQTAALVVTLPKTDSELQFDKVTYVATYHQHDESKDEISADPIKIIGVDDPTTVNVAIKESSTEISLDVTFDQDKSQWTISLKGNLPPETIDAEVSILVTLEAITSEGATADAGMIVMLPKKVVPANFSFKKPYYNADYTITDGSSNLTISDEIVIEGTTDNINVKLDGEYKGYLSVKTTPKEGIMEVAITLKEAFNETIVNENAAIAVDIVATKGEQIATAPLVITLPKKTISGDDDSEDKTGLIAAVAVLAVLLVASLVGSAVFYYFKFKKGSNYNNMDDAPRLSDRFRKNSNTTDSKYKFEHPTRRPTGVIKLPLNDKVVGETATDEVVVPSEKRKSVQFDTINIDELEIEKSEEDVDDIGEGEEDKDDDDDDSEEMAEENDERRASHV